MTESTITIHSHLAEDWSVGAMREDITRAFSRTPKVLPPKWLYDDEGSDLFDQITRLPEYYLTEAERSLLIDHADEIVRHTGATSIVELGSGTSDKTRTLLDAFHRADQLEHFLPLDVSQATLISAAEMLAERYPGIDVQAVVGDFTRHLSRIPAIGRRMVAFLGSTLGNFYEEERRAFLGVVADVLAADEWLLIGVDLVKDTERTLAAYNDDQGVSEAFAKNVLSVVNRSLGANFDVDRFDYVPFWDPHQERVDMRLRADEPHRARIEDLDLDVELAEGEEIRVEVSTKFRRSKLKAELEEAGFSLERAWTGNGDFGLFLARRR